MLNTSYSYYGDEIRFRTKNPGFEVEWDKGLFTNYLTNTHHANNQNLETVIYDLPTEVQFKILGDLLKTEPLSAFKIILLYNFKTLYGLSSALFSAALLIIMCQLTITIFSNLFH